MVQKAITGNLSNIYLLPKKNPILVLFFFFYLIVTVVCASVLGADWVISGIKVF